MQKTMLAKGIDSKIIIVTKEYGQQKYEVAKQAFATERFNSNQLESARRWASGYTVDGPFGQRATVSGFEYILDNKDFTVEIIDPAGESNQGGRLSFWNCLFTQGDKKFVIGVNQDSLFDAMRQSTVVNGVFTEKMSIIKRQNGTGIIHPGMKDWIPITNSDTETASMTSKWKYGRVYSAKVKSDVFIGEIYNWATKEVKYNERYKPGRKYMEAEYHIKVNQEPAKFNILEPDYSIRNSNLHSISDYIQSMQDHMNKNKGGYSLLLDLSILNEYQMTKSTTRRYEGEQLLESVDHIAEQTQMNEMLNNLRRHFVARLTSRNETHLMYDIERMFYTGLDTTKPEFTEDERNIIMSKLPDTYFVDFGDGVELQGMKQ